MIERKVLFSFPAGLRSKIATLTAIGLVTPLVASMPRPARASWPPGGVPVCTNTAFQSPPSMAPDAAGGMFFVWDDSRNGTPDQVYGQKIDMNGVAQWTTNGIPLGPAFSIHPNITADGAGGFVAVWMTNFNIAAQRFNSNGSALWTPGGVNVCAATGTQDWPQVIPGASGEFIVVWRDARNGANDVFANRLSAAGAVLAGANGVQVGLGTGDISEVSNELEAVADDAGGAYLTWNSIDVGNIHGQHISSNVVPQWAVSVGLTLTNAAGEQLHPRVAGAGASGAIFVWDDNGAMPRRPFAQWITLSGIARYAANGVPLFSSGIFQSVLLTSAGYIATARDNVQRFDPLTAAPQWVPNPVSLAPPSGSSVELASDGADGAIAVYRPNNDTRLVAQRVNGSGASIWPGKTIDVCTGALPAPPQLIKDTFGGVVAGWQDFRAGNYDVYGQRIGVEGYIGVRSNLDALTGYAPYWDGPVVPRNAASGDVMNVHLTPLLDGNLPTTYVNALFWQSGPLNVPAFSWTISLDTEQIGYFSSPDGTAPGGYGILDGGPIEVRGGRHSLAMDLDEFDQVLESNEGDNEYLNQWVWSPLVTAPGVGLERFVPPPRGDLVLPNSDGFSFTRDPGFAWVVSLAPRDPEDDNDLFVYTDYTGSASGFSSAIGSSEYGVNATDFVVGHYSGTPVTVYPGAVRYYVGPEGSNTYFEDQIDASNRNGFGTGSFLDQVLPGGRITDVYEANLSAGTSYTFTLHRISGASDINLELFPPIPGAVFSRGEGRSGFSVHSDLDTLRITPTASGWFPLVVYRRFGTEADQDLRYSLYWNMGVTGVGSESAPELTFAGPRSNPMRGSSILSFSLSRGGPVRLTLFDVSGRRVRDLVDGALPPGDHAVSWDGRTEDGSRAPAGIYLARLQAENKNLVRKIDLLP